MSKNPTKKQIEEWKVIVKNLSKCRVAQLLKSKHKEIYNYILKITQNLTKSDNFSERAYYFIHNLKTNPKCPECNKDVKYINNQKGFQIFCSIKCSNKSKERRENHSKIWSKKSKEEISKITDKRKQFYLKLSNGLYTNIFQFPETTQKLKEIYLERSNGLYTNPRQFPETKQLTESTNMIRYGVKTPLQLVGYVSKISLKFINELLPHLENKKYYYDKEEWFLSDIGHFYSYDFTDKEQKKIIEFHGGLLAYEP